MTDLINYAEARKLAVGLAREAGAQVMKIISENRLAPLQKSHCGDLVTLADVESEKIIVGGVLSKYPNHRIITEESKQQDGESAYSWVIDPVDGTLAMVRGMDFGVSIGLWYGNQPVVGVIYIPTQDVLIESEFWRGTFLNDQRVYLQDDPHLEVPLIDFAFVRAGKNRSYNFDKFLRPVIDEGVQSVFSCGSTVFAASRLIRGHIDAFINPGATIYDIGAVLLTVKESGGVCDVIGGVDLRRNLKETRFSTILTRSERFLKILKQ